MEHKIHKSESSESIGYGGEHINIVCDMNILTQDNTCEHTNIDDILSEFQALELGDDDDSSENVQENYQIDEDALLAKTKDYELNYTMKELGFIYEYYGLGKVTKLKKIEVIQNIVFYENIPENIDMVERRKLMWEYMRELKEDPFLKKYIIAP